MSTDKLWIKQLRVVGFFDTLPTEAMHHLQPWLIYNICRLQSFHVLNYSLGLLEMSPDVGVREKHADHFACEWWDWGARWRVLAWWYTFVWGILDILVSDWLSGVPTFVQWGISRGRWNWSVWALLHITAIETLVVAMAVMVNNVQSKHSIHTVYLSR